MKIDVKGVIVPNEDKWVYDWLEREAVCPRDVLNGIAASMGGKLDVYINSPGGDVFAGSEIYSALREHSGSVNIHVVGQACSAASFIMCAGKCDVTPTGLIMIHNASGVAQGDYHALDKGSELLQKANRAIAAAYREKTGKSEAEVLAMMDRETWMTAEEAIEVGLADGITPAAMQFTASATELLPPEVIEKIRNTVKNPLGNEADFSMRRARAQLEMLRIGGMKE